MCRCQIVFYKQDAHDVLSICDMQIVYHLMRVYGTNRIFTTYACISQNLHVLEPLGISNIHTGNTVHTGAWRYL
jgi:hypothetical protein